MSQRPIQKRENSKKHLSSRLRQNKNRINNNNNKSEHFVAIQRSRSCPNISENFLTSTLSCLVTSFSETDVSNLAQQENNLNANSISEMSDICIVKIFERRMVTNTNKRNATRFQQKTDSSLLNLGKSRVLSANNDSSFNNKINPPEISDCHSISVSSASNSTIITPSEYQHRGFTSDTTICIPIIGYEIMEERARFTVYKLRVENPFTNDCWLVLRRYTDFVRLHNKLKQMLPHVNLQLPKKKIFGDNFNAVFLDNRVQGLQMFVNSIMANNDLRCSKLVREFFCLDEPPSYSESMEECRAIFEAQEETIAHLKLQINSKNDLIFSLQQKLIREVTDNDRLENTLKSVTAECNICSKKIESLEMSQ